MTTTTYKPVRALAAALALALASGLAVAPAAQAAEPHRVKITNRIDYGTLSALPSRDQRPVPNGTVTYRFRLHWTERICWDVVDRYGYLRRKCESDSGVYQRQHERTIRLNAEGSGSRVWSLVEPFSESGPEPGRLHGWYVYRERAVGVVIVRNAAGRVVERYDRTLLGYG